MNLESKSLSVTVLTPEFETSYQEFIELTDKSMLYHSLKYRKLLKTILPNSVDHYLCVFKDSEIVGLMPLFIHDGLKGKVINSLPFFGSHGGILFKEGYEKEVFELLSNSLNSLIRDSKASLVTLIEPLFGAQSDLYDIFNANFFDYRTGQITRMPMVEKKDQIDLTLMSCIHSKTRNLIRKGFKHNFSVSSSYSEEDITSLQDLHNLTMDKIGGSKKPDTLFHSIPKIFNYGKDYKIYTAKKDGVTVSALLLFYFKNYIEYFIPATHPDFRSSQALSVLIFNAMEDAIRNWPAGEAELIWNWGGTWGNQSGVYHFKSRWNAQDIPYRYHVKVLGDFSGLKPTDFLKMYPYFYCIPFSQLN